jgi:hypothetical protein
MRWTEEELAAHQARVGLRGAASCADVSRPPFKLPNNQAGAFALGRLPTGTMNKTEAAYDAYLQTLHHTGESSGTSSRASSCGSRTTLSTPATSPFCPDPACSKCTNAKGFWQDDAKVKIKVAASIYPFKFIAVKKIKGGWEQEEFS